MVRGKRNDGQPKKPKTQTPVTGPISVTCDRCGLSVPAGPAGGALPHYDPNVPDSHISKTYCK